MTYDILYESCPWHTRAALFDDRGRLLSLRLDDPSRPLIEDTVVLGRVRRVVQGVNAAFVDIGDREDAFLRLNSLPNDVPVPTEGQPLMVRVTRGSDMQKGARVDARVSLKMPTGELKIPSILAKAPSALRRALMDAGDHPIRCWVVDERSRAEVEEFVGEDRVFQLNQHDNMDLLEQVDTQLDNMHTRSYPIAGGQVTVEITKALAAIDVDAGDLGSGSSKTSVLEVNKRSAAEFVRLCRLLDLGGNIVVDFVSMGNAKSRKVIQDYLKEQFVLRDMAKVEVFPMSRFGLLEINRERRGAMIHELMEYPAYVAGRILLEIWRERGGLGDIYVDAATEVADVLKQCVTTDAALAYFGRPLTVKAQEGWPMTKFATAVG